MKQQTLNVYTRQQSGRRSSKRLRAQNKIPAVIYGESGTKWLSINEGDLRHLLRRTAGSTALIKIVDDQGEERLSIIQDLDRDPLTDLFLHVDFKEVSYGQSMTVNLPVHIEGESIGVKNENGAIEVVAHEITAQCLPKNLPDHIQVDISELHAGESIHINDLQQFEGVEFTDDPETVIISCTHPITEEEEASEEEASEEEGATGNDQEAEQGA